MAEFNAACIVPEPDGPRAARGRRPGGVVQQPEVRMLRSSGCSDDGIVSAPTPREDVDMGVDCLFVCLSVCLPF